MIDPHPRSLMLWVATHDNGWTTSAVERPDGTFSAFANPGGEMVAVERREATADMAKRSAMQSLVEQTGHATCSERCSGWQLHSIEPDASGGEE